MKPLARGYLLFCVAGQLACLAPVPSRGRPCENDAECASLKCIDKICGGPPPDARVIDRNTNNISPFNTYKPPARDVRVVPDVSNLPNGEYCLQDDSVCLSKNCVNRRCCDTPCTETCKRCDVEGHLGKCTIAPGTPCAEENCRGNISSHRACSESGTCDSKDLVQEDCGVYVCDGTTGRCMETCTEEKGCIDDYKCLGGDCFLDYGQPCSEAGECLSGICSKDGVCCDAACDGFCESCKINGSEGKCIKVPDGQDPDNECEEDEASTCQKDGFCDGAGSCGLYGKQTVCQGTPTCDGDMVKGHLCDGQGSCKESSTSCEPFLCNVSEGVCHTSCSGTGEGQCPDCYACRSDNTCHTSCQQPFPPGSAPSGCQPSCTCEMGFSGTSPYYYCQPEPK